MSYIRAFISTCEAFGWTGGPGFMTDIQQLRSGRESRNGDWMHVQHFYTVPFQNIVHSLYVPIKRMHMACMGRLHCFLYRDRSDWEAIDEVFAIAEPGQTIFQLSKLSTQDGVSYQRNVYALYEPEENGDATEIEPEITADNAPVTVLSVDYDRAEIVTAPMAGGEVMRWTGSFAVWVRFDNDRLPFSIDNKSGGEFVLNGSIDLLEMFPPLPETSSSSSS
jgi:uncharacterized protein (TIGR02217 family)